MRPTARHDRLCRYCLTALLLCSGLGLGQAALAQRVATNDTGWQARPAAEYVNPALNLSIRNVTGPNYSGSTIWSATIGPTGAENYGVLRQAQRNGTNNLGGATNEYFVQQSWERRFTLAEAATVYAPSMLNAVIGANRAGGAQGFTGGTIDASVLLQRWDGTSWVAAGTVSQLTHSVASAGPLNNQQINSNWTYSSVNAPAGDYRLLANLSHSALVTFAAPQGSVVGAVSSWTEGDSAARGGFMASFAAIPQNLATNSRTAVRADRARADFNVDGTGITAAVLEGGLVYANHASLAPARLAFSGGFDQNRASEHALAVAGIIGSTDAGVGNAGVAPGVGIYSHRLGFLATRGDDLERAMTNATVVNMSFGSGALTPDIVDAKVNANPSVPLVVAADNSGSGQAAGTNRLTSPSDAWNAIHVGGVNRDFVSKAPFSAFNDTTNAPKIALVAPAEYVNSAVLGGSNGSNAANQFGRVFVGDEFDHTNPNGVNTVANNNVTTGTISGNSFAAPHVAGAIALMQQYAANNAASFDASARDGRLARAIMVNSATTTGLRRLNADGTVGGAWSQVFAGNLTQASPLRVTRSLDPQLGGGMLDAASALRTLASGELRPADNNTATNFNINAVPYLTQPANAGGVPAKGRLYNQSGFWDMDSVKAAVVGPLGESSVNYLLGDVSGQTMRATLTWDRIVADGANPADLALQLWVEGVNTTGGSSPGYDPTDIMLATTTYELYENIKLLWFTIPTFEISGLPGYRAEDSQLAYYLRVVNASAADTTYALAVQIPTPGGLTVLLGIGVLARRRRPAA